MFAVFMPESREFAGINSKYAWPTRPAAETAAAMYRDTHDQEYVVVELVQVAAKV